MTRKSKHSDVENRRRDVLRSIDLDSSRDGAGRRGFLRGAAASVLATVGLTGPAVAVDPTGQIARQRAKQPFQSDAALQRAVETHGEDVLELLAERGHIEQPSVAEFSRENLRLASRSYDGTTTAHIHGRLALDDGKVTVTVEPQAERQYAVLTVDGETTILDPSVEGDEVTTAPCLEQSACTYELDCASGCGKYELFCCDNCYYGDFLGCCDTSDCPDDCTKQC